MKRVVCALVVAVVVLLGFQAVSRAVGGPTRPVVERTEAPKPVGNDESGGTGKSSDLAEPGGAHSTSSANELGTVETVDAGGVVGVDVSMTTGTDGFGLISYRDGTNMSLKVAHCENATCSSATTTTLDATADVGLNTSIMIGPDGLGIIAYTSYREKIGQYYEWSRDLKVAHCQNLACTSATTTEVDTLADVHGQTGITISGGKVVISYVDLNLGGSQKRLKLAWCRNSSCTLTSYNTVLQGSFWYPWTSIIAGVDGAPYIAYTVEGAGQNTLRLVRCATWNCSSVASNALISRGTTRGDYRATSMVRDLYGMPLISYQHADLGRPSSASIALCASLSCDGPGDVRDLGPVDLSASTLQTSIRIGEDDLPIIAYRDSQWNDLRVRHCSDELCQNSITTSLDESSDVFNNVALTIGGDGLPLIAYMDNEADDLLVVHCGDVACANGVATPF